MTKIIIRFYNDREVRAVWDEEKSKWWFSAVSLWQLSSIAPVQESIGA